MSYNAMATRAATRKESCQFLLLLFLTTKTKESIMKCFHIISKSAAKSIGLKKYFTGKPCKYGHVDLRFTASNKCLSCHELTLNRKPFVSDSEKAEKRKELQKERGRRYYEKNKQKVKDRSKVWKKSNPDKLKQSWSNWRKKDSSKAIMFMRSSLRRVLKTEKNGRTEHVLGYSRYELRSHIERQFLKGMSWDNHGEWHIDHITPISVFLEQGISDPRVINCLTNLKPIWAKDNLSKNNKLEYLI